MKRDLFVFAGQSNMMGASVYPVKHNPTFERSFEYKHKPRRFGAARGVFVSQGYPVGEFSYKDMALAYASDMCDANGNSMLADYRHNTYFCPSMASLLSEEERTELPFSAFSEATAKPAASPAPLLVEEYERAGGTCAYTHIAKGSVRISHYFTDDMALEYAARVAEYNRLHGTDYQEGLSPKHRMPGAADYFFEKCTDFFADATERFPTDDLTERCFFWLQGEGDAGRSSTIEYEIALDILWQTLKKLGFTRFFCIRAGYFGKEAVDQIMLAQERFVKAHDDAYMLTRVGSYFPFKGHDDSNWFVSPPPAECQNCRDSFSGFENQHINEKGFLLIASRAAKNLWRVLKEGGEPLLEPENIRPLKEREETT